MDIGLTQMIFKENTRIKILYFISFNVNYKDFPALV